MKVNIRYFAIVRERLGCNQETIDLPVGATVADALAFLAKKHSELGVLLPHVRVAVDQTMVGIDEKLVENAELALIPPVAGGTGASLRIARIVLDRAPSLTVVTEAVTTSKTGGLVCFSGLVRDNSQGRSIASIEYEAFVEMADKVLGELCDEIEREIPGARVAIEHRVGRLSVSEVAVVIAAGAPHRREAFRACQALIDRVKERVPIWKKETSSSGDSWVGMGP